MLRPYLVINRVSILSWDLGKYLGRGEAFRQITYGKKLEIYDRNASPSCKQETGFLFDFSTSANIWVRNPVSEENKKPGFYVSSGLRQIFG